MAEVEAVELPFYASMLALHAPSPLTLYHRQGTAKWMQHGGRLSNLCSSICWAAGSRRSAKSVGVRGWCSEPWWSTGSASKFWLCTQRDSFAQPAKISQKIGFESSSLSPLESKTAGWENWLCQHLCLRGSFPIQYDRICWQTHLVVKSECIRDL